MSQQGNDHYVPQFILRRFLPKGKGRRKERLFYAEKATPGISRRGAARTFCEVGGDLLLRGPPGIRQEGTHAILADEPEYTTGIREHLSRARAPVGTGHQAPRQGRLSATPLTCTTN